MAHEKVEDGTAQAMPLETAPPPGFYPYSLSSRKSKSEADEEAVVVTGAAAVAASLGSSMAMSATAACVAAGDRAATIISNCDLG